jgi:hypothetical protein
VRKETAELIMQGLSFRDSEKEYLAYAEGYLDLVRNLIHQAKTTSGAERQQHLHCILQMRQDGPPRCLNIQKLIFGASGNEALESAKRRNGCIIL